MAIDLTEQQSDGGFASAPRNLTFANANLSLLYRA